MNKKQLITVWIFSILISIISYGNVYSAAKISKTVKSSYTENIIGKMLYKKVVLPGGDNRPVLVNRITGEVKYIWVNNSQWIFLMGMWKKQCQAKYNAQISSKR